MATVNDLLAQVQTNLKAQGVDSTKKECGVALEAVLNAIQTAALDQGSIRTAIGTFKRKDCAARQAHNPKTGDKVDVPAKTTVSFKSYYNEVVGEKKAAKKAAPAKAAAPAKKAVKKGKK